jgi:hypothetical protein
MTIPMWLGGPMNKIMTLPTKTEIATLPAVGTQLPIRKTDELKANVKELYRIASVVSEALDICDKPYYPNPRFIACDLQNAERSLEKLGELPQHFERTMALLDEVMQKATPCNIADGLTVLCGLFGNRGDPEIVAGAGVDLIEAEHVSQIALYSAVVTMLRPGEEKRKAVEWWESPEKLPPRKFMPTMPEIIAELQDQQEWWRRKQVSLKGLPECLVQAREQLTKRITKLQEAKVEIDARA